MKEYLIVLILLAISTNALAYVLNESFENTAFPPSGWTNQKTAGSGEPGTWDRQSSGTNPSCQPFSGTGMARYNTADWIDQTSGVLATPPLAIVSDVLYKVSFQMFRDDLAPYHPDEMSVYLNSAPTSVGGEELLTIRRHYMQSPSVSVPNQWYGYTAFFSGNVYGTLVHLIFEGYGGMLPNQGSNIFIDDVKVEIATQPSFSIQPDIWNFGNVILGQPALKQFTVLNNGTGPGIIYSLTVDSEGFSLVVDPTPVSVNPGASVSFTVNFQPSTYGSVAGSVACVYEYGFEGNTTTNDVWLSGTGYYPAITSFPFSEDFESGVFPPLGWAVYDMDGEASSWVLNNNQNHSPGGTYSALHPSSDETPDPGQNGWLVSPPISIPAMGGGLYLSFWSYNADPQNYLSNDIYISTSSPDPAIGSYQQWEEIQFVDDEWIQNQFDGLWLYEYQTIHIAFRYQGCDADDWYLDDVKIYAPDLLPPMITHLPLLDSPRNDIPYRASAQIVDDWENNNDIAAASVFYSVNAGPFTELSMQIDSPDTYYADIPAQPLDSEVNYFIQAWDDQGNSSTTDTFLFTVTRPVWLNYTSDMEPNYVGFTSLDYGYANLFANPFFGSGSMLKIVGVSGQTFDSEFAMLHIYSYDGNNLIEVLPQPRAAEFVAQTQLLMYIFDTEVLIDTQWFMVSFEAFTSASYFAVDESRDYFMSYYWRFGQLYQNQSPGSWAISAFVTDGTLNLPAPEASIEIHPNGDVSVFWNEVPNAASYNVFGSADPTAPDTWQLMSSTSLTFEYFTLDHAKYFFKVTASTDPPPEK